MIALTASCSTIQDTYEHFKTKEVVQVNPYDQFRFKKNDHSISRDLSNDEYIKKFKELSCTKKKEEECVLKYKEMRDARFKLKYKNADIETIKLFCVGYPVECENNEYLESVYIASNNFVVDRLEEQAKKAELARQEAETNAAIMGIASSFAQYQQNRINDLDRNQQQQFIREQVQELKRSNCTTNVWGNLIQTQCN